MLEFRGIKQGYQIIEKTFTFRETKINIITYSKDLSKKKINDDPWIETTESCKRWFIRYYLKKFL